MSDDIPVIFAQTVLKPQPLAIFLSATHATQMEQYVVAGWRVARTQDFQGCEIPRELPIDVFDPASLDAAPCLIIGDIMHLNDDWRHMVTLFTPESVKINAAFTEDAAKVTEVAAFLTGQNYTMCASYWRNDNSFSHRILDRIDALSVFQPTPWTNLNLIGYKETARAHTMVRFGRFYAGQEQRIGDLEVKNAIRADHISQLEAAMMALQKRRDSSGA
jgi:hypothetical protein